jgi:hypothetical protein
MATAIDAKGDLIAGTGADAFSRLAVGANDLLLTAASGEATGLKYTGGWTTWTPTFTNFTLGNGTIIGARYQQIGKTVNFVLYISFGSTTSVSGLVQFSLPISAAAGVNSGLGTQLLGRAFDANTTLNYTLVGRCYLTDGYILTLNSAGTYAQQVGTSATAPFTWAVSDELIISGTYEVA